MAQKYITDTTMSVVSNDIVGNAYYDFTNNNVIGRWINDNAYNLFKAGGVVNNVASGLGEVTTIGGISLLTGVPAWMFAGVEATGEFTEEAWQRMKTSGELMGENYNKGLAYGATNAIWEMAQWSTGMKLNNLKAVGGSKVAASAVRVGIDTAFNAIDTPFRSLITSGTFNRDFVEEFEERGGWNSVIADVGIGLVGSVAGEVGDVIKTSRIDSKNRKIISEYLENIEEYTARGVSMEEYLYNNGIRVVDCKTRLEVAENFGDGKLYLEEKVFEYHRKENLPSAAKGPLDTVFDDIWNFNTGNLDSKTMLKDLKEVLSDEDFARASKLIKSGNAERRIGEYSKNQLAAVFNYTNYGGFEINSWLNDTYYYDTGSLTRERYRSMARIQNSISGKLGNKVFPSSQGDILEALDSVISFSRYDDAFITYRGVKGLYDRGIKIDPQNLRIGDSFESAGYQSSSVLLEDCYAMKHRTIKDTNIILKVIVPPRSGTAAYIENISGVMGYGQMEMLIKRDAKMTVIGDIEYFEKYGRLKTIVPVIVQ